ncbi:MAG: phosphoadenylyl-sulfate reductase [Chloroflexi bacterium]|nr:phosphoadenylyl-sulfate reductase [Chloroflexota bacterium]
MLDFERLNQDFETAAPQHILKWAVDEFGTGLSVVTSFQPTGIATLHMLSEIAPQTPVLTLDTGLLFQETYALMDEVERRFNLNLTRIRPALTVEQQAAEYGEALWERDADQCCHMRKVAPLDAVLGKYPAWITGLRRDQTGRGATPIISWDAKHQNVKLSPFATWTEEMIWLYVHTYDLPYNALHDQSYPSIGCNTPTCTQPVTAGADGRSGRWVNSAKTECGIHTSSTGAKQES